MKGEALARGGATTPTRPTAPVRLTATLMLAVASLSACSDDSITATTPAPTPSTSTTLGDATTTTSTVATAVTTPSPTTTEVDRRTEIEAIFQDLETRRLDALYRQDEEAFRALFANEAYLEESLAVLGTVAFDGPPTDPTVLVLEVITDSPACLAAELYTDFSRFLGPASISTSVVVLETKADDSWGFSYAGDGWSCEGDHPLGQT